MAPIPSELDASIPAWVVALASSSVTLLALLFFHALRASRRGSRSFVGDHDSTQVRGRLAATPFAKAAADREGDIGPVVARLEAAVRRLEELGERRSGCVEAPGPVVDTPSPARAETPRPSAPAAPSGHTDPLGTESSLAARVRLLADQGKDTIEIARLLDAEPSTVRLILSLQGRPSADIDADGRG